MEHLSGPLVSELHLAAGVKRDDGNRVVRDYLPRFNARLAVPPPPVLSIGRRRLMSV